MVAKPDWYPDWTGEACAIVASGPSVGHVNHKALEGRIRTIAIKENIDICPWAEMVYGCDWAFWRNREGMPDYAGLKVAWKSKSEMVRVVRIVGEANQLMTAEPGLIGSGGNSGFQALNMAIQFGATRILLLGFDMSDQYGVHWFGRSQGDGRAQPSRFNFQRWRVAFAVAATQLQGLGVQVLNASPLTALTCFPVVTVEDALREWKL
jgi:hypothetical protein